MRISGFNPQMAQMTQMNGLGQAGGQGDLAKQLEAAANSPALELDGGERAGINDGSFGPSLGSGSPSLRSGDNFGTMLNQALTEVNGMQGQSRQMQNDYMTGKPVEFHDLMITMEKASTAMALTLQVRNKLLEAFQEIQRTQI